MVSLFQKFKFAPINDKTDSLNFNLLGTIQKKNLNSKCQKIKKVKNLIKIVVCLFQKLKKIYLKYL